MVRLAVLLLLASAAIAERIETTVEGTVAKNRHVRMTVDGFTYETRVDAKGQFRFTILLEKKTLARFTCGDFVSGLYLIEPGRNARIALTLPDRELLAGVLGVGSPRRTPLDPVFNLKAGRVVVWLPGRPDPLCAVPVTKTGRIAVSRHVVSELPERFFLEGWLPDGRAAFRTVERHRRGWFYLRVPKGPQVNGIVRDVRGRPVAGVRIRVGPTEARTNVLGRFVAAGETRAARVHALDWIGRRWGEVEVDRANALAVTAEIRLKPLALPAVTYDLFGARVAPVDARLRRALGLPQRAAYVVVRPGPRAGRFDWKAGDGLVAAGDTPVASFQAYAASLIESSRPIVEGRAAVVPLRIARGFFGEVEQREVILATDELRALR